ncbi:hydantoinase B/oxoprolinase family protein [Spirosoma endophyticum]|uniref:5-oxoprolinase (ATP-hydrolysing) n=1 Tax=Spirosoma endophyticum TaxID=662367 RepID=A0A1I1VY00_9BACT|nr:hydantoinase B/oxoprolinase family protein [Spirosoma endophyticum]SFD86958.1 5-oxoprolinase (ATP-hydrolysing) [Spirosoma endophyticum]
MYQIWIDTGGTFTDGLALDPNRSLHRTKVLSSSRLRGQLINGKLVAPWLTAPIFNGYQLRIVETDEVFTLESLQVNGRFSLNGRIDSPVQGTVELFTGEEAPVLAARLLTQTPINQPFPNLEMRLGTTKGTNALLERKGGNIVLLVTKGFKDLLKIGTQQRPDLFQLAIPPAEVLYHSVLEVAERMAADGQTLTPLSDQAIAALITQVQQAMPDAVAVSLLNAYRNPTHEQKLRDALKIAGFPYVTISTDVSTAPQYIARTQTAVVDAYLTPVMRSYLDNVQQQLGNQPVRIMTSAGGLVRADLFRPKDSLLSGPAGGVIGAAAIADSLLQSNTLTLDMGGTSTDVARIQGNLDYRFSTKIGPFDLQLPSLAIETVAAGGGSVCWFDETGSTSGQLRVGPQSAGANPGPACYGAGLRSANEPDQTPLLTITDVNLLLGKLDAQQFGIPIFPEKAQAALDLLIQQIEAKTGSAPTGRALLRGFERIANETMAGAIRKISVARGFDPKEYGLLVFGGAGGLHGCAIARLLGMERIILPFDGGLLSAYGIGQAQIERMASRSVLQPLSKFESELPGLVDELINTATHLLKQDVGNSVPVSTKSVAVFLRLSGQEATIDVPFSNQLEPDFQQKYQHLYGHFPAERPVEVESIRVIVSTVSTEKPVNSQPVSHRHAVPARQIEVNGYAVYDWTQLQEGDTFRGPALLLNTTSSAFIESGWRLIVQADKNAVVDYIEDTDEPTVAETNEIIQLELFTQRFRAIAEEMGAQLQRTAFSVNVKERLDFSCALLDARAELVANAPHIPVHLGSLGVCARLILAKLAKENLPLEPGDVIITNHPKYGGSHLPDVTLLSGVFADRNIEGTPQLIGYVINRAHHAEIGGKVPGSMPPDAVSLVEEGVVLEPMFIVKEGMFQWEGPSGIATRFTDGPYPTRALAENRADIEAALASLRAGETTLQTLVQQHGLATVHHYMTRLQQSATDAISTILKPLDGQTYLAEESLDDGHIIRVKLTVNNGRITFDFTGTSGVHPNNLNANISILYSAVLYVLRLWCGRDIPLNEGLMVPVDLILPEASFLNPIFPESSAECPAVVGGNTEVSQRLVDTLLKALGLAACSQGTMNNFLFGKSARTGAPVTPEPFGYYETIGGGAGATEGADGRSAVHQHMTNTKLTDPEEFERRYPVRLHQFAIRSGSGGAGQWRGGDGIIREIEFLEPVQATLLSQHRMVAPYGLNGGEPGATGRQTLIHTDGNEEVLPGIFTRAMHPGERIRIETPGGGGVGINRE